MRRRLIALGVLVAAASLLYVRRLDYVPALVGWDEVFFGLQAHSIATTGNDVLGNHLPLYFRFSDKVFFQPMIVYATAAVFRLLPLSEATLRLPTAIFALVDIVLMYFVAWKIFKSEALAFTAAALLAITPAHVIHGRVALDYVYPLPFILAWLLCLAAFVERPRPWLIATGSAALGIGMYSYLAAVIMLPLYLAMTFVVVAATSPKPKTRYLAELGVFFVMLIPVLVWLRGHPRIFVDYMTRYGVYDTKLYSPLQGAKEFTSFGNMTHRIAMYWDYLGPSYLYLQGGIKPSISTTRVGVFLLPFIVFLPVGLFTAIGTRRNWIGWVVAAGFLTAPAAALLVDDPFAIDRELMVVPFGVLLGTYGIARLMASPRRTVRLAAVVLIVLGIRDFKGFVGDYFGDYRDRSARYFDDQNIRAGLEEILVRGDGREPAVFLHRDIGNIENYWHFYLLKHQRLPLLARTTVFDPATLDLHSVPSGSLLLAPIDDARFNTQVQAGRLTVLKTVHTAEDRDSLVVLERREGSP